MKDSKKTKTCPKCGGTMEFRLGDYECAECGHSEPAEAVSEKGKPKWAPPPPLTSPVESMTRLPSHLHEIPAEPSHIRPPPLGLTIEKVLILVLSCACLLLVGAVMLAAPPGFGGLPLVVWLVLLLPFILVFLLAIAFFAPTIRLKWTCFGCSIIAVLFPFGVLFWLGCTWQYFFSSLFYAILPLWIASVLYRDIRWRKRY